MSVSKPDCRVRVRERINRIPPSAERNGRGLSSGFDTGHQDNPVPESTSSMPSLPDLLDELETDAVDLSALEQLTQTLLEDIARDLESAAQKSTDQVSGLILTKCGSVSVVGFYFLQCTSVVAMLATLLMGIC